MLDANATRYHLLLGEVDWRPLADPARGVEWDAARHRVTLRTLVHRFVAGRGDRAPAVEDRRGAAMDAYGNWYLLDEAARAVLVTSPATRATTAYWPAPAVAPEAPAGAFAAAPAPPRPSLRLSGLAVSAHHHLVVGAVDDATGRASLLVFDLHGVGTPWTLSWPDAPTLTPWDISPTPDGGLWLLDRVARRYWRLDRHLGVLPRRPVTDAPGRFGPSPGVERAFPARAPSGADAFSLADLDGTAAEVRDPIAIEALPDGSVLVLDRGAPSGPSAVLRFVHTRQPDGTVTFAASTRLSLAEVFARLWTSAEAPMGGTAPAPLAHDLAFVPDAGSPWSGRGDLYLAAGEGNQAFKVRLTLDAAETWETAPTYLPMRLFRGRALTVAEGRPWYDAGARFVPLVAQNLSRYTDIGALDTRVFDGRAPGCVWHRLALDGCIPAGASVRVWSRAGDDASLLDTLSWEAEPPLVYSRKQSELPFVAPDLRPGGGTWEILFQRARGRFLQLRVELSGDGVRSPTLEAMRVWYPRFSYRDRYLPAVYRDQDVAGLLDRWLANFEGTLTAVEDRIAGAHCLLDLRAAPPEALDWLAAWFDLALDPAWDDARRRLFLRRAMDFFAMRGTARGVRAAVALAAVPCADERVFDDDGAAFGPFGVRVVEHFRAREYPTALLPDVTAPAPSETLAAVAEGARWRPAEGVGGLVDRYRAFVRRATGGEATAAFPTRAPAEHADAWRAFVRQLLGAPDLAGGVDEPGWRAYLASRYGTIEALRAAHGGAATTFDAVPYPDPLPPGVRVLEDWFRFESIVRPMRRTAHRFTVLVPVPAGGAVDEAAVRERLRLVERVVALEKPAHTVFDVRPYWAVFRVGYARLGHDTLIDLGGLAPDLMPPAVVGRAYLAQSHLGWSPAHDAAARVVAGYDVLTAAQSPPQEMTP